MWWYRGKLLLSVRTGTFMNLKTVEVCKAVVLENIKPRQWCRSITSEASSVQVSPTAELDQKIVKVAFIGRPNVGKSTLINQVVGRTICPISMKAHTTRVKVKAFVNEGNTQIVFLDTPGLVSSEEIKKYKFESEFLKSAEDALQEADVIGVVHDASFTNTLEMDPLCLRLLFLYQRKRSFLVLNKVDALKNKHNLLKLARALTCTPKSPIAASDQLTEQQVMQSLKKIRSWPHFAEVFMISALMGDGEYLLNEAHPGEWIVKKEKVQNQENLAIAFVRAACLDFLQDEIPYSLQFKINYFEDYGDKCAVEVRVIARNNRHRRMAMAKVRSIAAYAESHLASALEKECRLRLQMLSVDDLADSSKTTK
ncbi:GTPase Era, mitochondrial [Frankliniella fusca]|uniref:GTPase Era, mitochondrial n=1 Tax=Frankliniella fusca TaxID=407009 RepID=A0AAE1HDV5_9NEOP|nr:GTPase Era, mitochondrial [Frankliniella fusca]